MKTISIITPCYNEDANVDELYQRVRAEIVRLGKYRYEHIFIDNSSQDRTVAVLKGIAARDHNVRIIVNTRNFGHVRSPMHAFLQTQGDCVIGIVADLQDPPELIPQMVAKWEEGYSMVLCIKRTSEENPLMFWLRKKFYRTVQRLSTIQTFENFTGFGLYDRQVVEAVRAFGDPYPYFRGIIAEIGLPHYELPYDQPPAKRANNQDQFLHPLRYGYARHHEPVQGTPSRMVTFLGFASAAIVPPSAGLVYFVYKLVFWANFTVGIAPLVIGLFFLGSVQLLSMGILGEYVGSVHTQVQRRPYVIERERMNFEYPPGDPPPEKKK